MGRLLEYENVEADGSLLRLPCKPGDEVYRIRDTKEAKTIETFIVDAISIKKDDCIISVVRKEHPFNIMYWNISAFECGRIFTTKQAALQAMKEGK